LLEINKFIKLTHVYKESYGLGFSVNGNKFKPVSVSYLHDKT